MTAEPAERELTPITFVEAPTESRNPRTTQIDMMPTREVLRLINAEDRRVPVAVDEVLPQIELAVDLAVEALRGSGRVHYFGAGSSGRIAAMDAAELPPTYALEPGRVIAHHAGGVAALAGSVATAEDDASRGARDAEDVAETDVVVGLTASGRTPYVVGALRAAAAVGASTVLVSANPHAAFGREVHVHIGVDTGPEVIAGSTRMKAGTAQKLVLNAFSTAVMVRLGRTYSNLMVGVSGGNGKLRGRLVTILVEATGRDPETCTDTLAAVDGDLRVALVALLCDVPVERATSAVREAGGVVRDAVRLAKPPLGPHPLRTRRRFRVRVAPRP
ncbi:MAG TPA: N-acetylmuramic acid 6-phosphate etherase [Streptosporangiaceae bacterium]|jgi:N-acetylmuramic acid 6-phosphate etherase